MAQWNVQAEYDVEASVWYVSGSDVPGLAADAATPEAFERKIGPMILDLLQINAELITDEARLMPPHFVRIIYRHDHVYDLAA